MKAKRFSKISEEASQTLAKLVARGEFWSGESVSSGQGDAQAIKRVFERFFCESDEDDLRLKDEFSAKTIELVVIGCRELLAKMGASAECWREMGEFLDEELWEFSRLKEELAQSEKEVKMVRMKLEGASAPMNGEVSPKRVMACAMLLAEKEMRRDHYQGRVSMIIDQFVGRILAGTQNEPGGEILELRLRGVFGAL